MKNILEKTVLVVIILIPIGFFVYAMWGQNTATPNAPAPVQNTSATPAASSASISLNDASTLPQSVSVGAFVPFSFTIQNTGTAGGSIPFKIYVKWSTGEQDVIDENVVSLAGGQSTTVSEQLKFEFANETAQVYLELTETGKTVEFTLPRAD